MNGRDLGIARSRLRTVARQQAGAVERIEHALAWFVNDDGLCWPSLAVLHARIVAENDGVGLHRSTITSHVTRLPHYVTAGYLARNEPASRSGALRGVAVRAVRPELAVTLGFPPLAEALDRLADSGWLLPPQTTAADFVTDFVASSENGPKTEDSCLKTPTARRLGKNATRRSHAVKEASATETRYFARARVRARGDGEGRAA